MNEDAKYESLMNDYKVKRRDPEKFEEANKLLDEAMALKKSGKVSRRAAIAAQYL